MIEENIRLFWHQGIFWILIQHHIFWIQRVYQQLFWLEKLSRFFEKIFFNLPTK